jgi:cytochrome P450
VTYRDGFPVMWGAFPVVGHLPAHAFAPLAFDRLAEREVGPFFWNEAGFGLRQLQCLLPESFEVFKHPASSSEYVHERVPDLFGVSLIGKDGAAHRHQRSAMSAPFTPRGLTETGLGAEFAAIIERHVRGCDYETFMLVGINLPFDLPGSPWRRGRAAKARLDARIAAVVREVRARPDDNSMLAQLARGRDENGRGLDEQELADNLRLLILAGHETTASTMAWMVAFLAEHPDVWDTLTAEAASGEVPRAPSDLKRFSYAEAVFREALRLYPPVSRDARRARDGYELAGRPVPAGTYVGISIMYLSRHPSLHDQPDTFLPARWLSKSVPLGPLELMQFGGGPHFCLGYHVAWMEAVQFAVTFARVLSARGRRPALTGPFPAPRYMPLLHPDPGARVRFVA